jgi:long-chain acyl-CoA synthetase
MTYAEMDRITNRIASGLIALGVRRGDRVGIVFPNTPHFVMAFYGILKAGATVVAINPLHASAEIEHQLTDSSVSLVFVAHESYEEVKAAKSAARTQRLIVAGPREGTGLAPGDLWFQDIADTAVTRTVALPIVEPLDTALLQYSGGTTGASKAAVATHRGVVANTVQFRRWLVTLREAEEIILMAIPLYHAYGMIAGMSLGVSLGASLALVPSARDIPALLNTIHLLRPSVFPGVPALYNAINHQTDVIEGRVDIGSIRVCISGSTALMRQTKERFEELSGGKICEGYGLSEAPVVTHCNPLLGVNKIGSIGMPMPDVECRIVDPDNCERDVEPGGSGELLLRGPQLMKGYHNMPLETAETLRTLSDGKSWLLTGDIVRMDEDGYFYVVDRKKELIKPGGFQVWPREVEEVLASHPAVLEAGVAGVPDPERGEAVKAWIVFRPGASASSAEIREWCRERLTAYKVPSWIVFRAQLPKSTVGKVLRRELVREHRQSADPAL